MRTAPLALLNTSGGSSSSTLISYCIRAPSSQHKPFASVFGPQSISGCCSLSTTMPTDGRICRMLFPTARTCQCPNLTSCCLSSNLPDRNPGHALVIASHHKHDSHDVLDINDENRLWPKRASALSMTTLPQVLAGRRTNCTCAGATACARRIVSRPLVCASSHWTAAPRFLVFLGSVPKDCNE